MSDILTHGTLNTGLLASYDFEDDQTDSTGTNSALGLTGSYVTQNPGKGLSLNSSGQNEILDSTAWISSNADFSIELWVEFDSGTADAYLFVDPATGGSYSNFDFGGSTLSFQVGSFGGGTQVTVSSVTTGTLYHFVFTYDQSGGITEIYTDGVKGTSGSPNSFVNHEGLRLGFGGSGFPDGKISALRTWSKTLTQSEVTDLYNGGAGLPYSGGGVTYDAATDLSVPSLTGSATGTFVEVDAYDANSTEVLPSLIGSIAGTFVAPTPIGTLTTPTGGVFETDELIACSVDVQYGPATGVEMQINREGAGWVRWFDLTDPNVDDTWTGSLAANDTGV